MSNLVKEVTLSRFFILTLKNFLALTIWMIVLATLHFKCSHPLLHCIFHYMFSTYSINFLLTLFYLQNNRILTYEGCFGFHRIVNAKESRLYERVQYPQRVTCSQLRNAVSTSKWVASGWADSLLSLAFRTRWNPKRPSYVSIWLFWKVDYMRFQSY